MTSKGLKKIIFDKLYKDLAKVEIIDYENNIWFIDRQNKYWYFELKETGILWWRYEFFNSFFSLFSFDKERYEPLLKEWVEEVLNFRVNSTANLRCTPMYLVEEVLNCRVNGTIKRGADWIPYLEEILNHKVNATFTRYPLHYVWIDEVLNSKNNSL